MKVYLGKDKWKSSPIYYDPLELINGHIGIVGTSGTGKTHTIRKIVSELNNTVKPIKFHILDVHGDIEIKNCSTVKFSETSNYGLNPLKVNNDVDFGGVRKRIRSFISTINRTSRSLGSKQESALLNILTDLYAANGFYPNDHRTWSLDYDPYKYRKFAKKHPTLLDLKKYTEAKAKQMMTGGNSASFSKLEELNKKITALHRENKLIAKNGSDGEDEKFTKLKEECKELYNKYIDSLTPGSNSDDYFKYDNKDVIKSLYERLSNIESIGIFKDVEPPFDKDNPVWRYDIKSLERDEQKMFVDFLLGDIFFKCKQEGEKSEIETYVVIDEAHIFLSDDPEHIINIIAKEARKFGIGLILASQSFTHFPEDIISNLSTKIILGIDEMYHITSAKKLGIEVKRFNYIAPRMSAIVQLKKKGDTSNKFLDVVF